MKIWANVFDKIKWEDDLMNCNLSLWYTFLQTLITFKIANPMCHPLRHWFAGTKFGMIHKTLRHPPPKTSEPHASCNFQAQPPQQQLHLPNQHLLTCPIPLICRPIKSNLVLTQEYSAVVYLFIFIRSLMQKYYIFALLLFHCRSRQFNFVAFNHKPLGQNMHPKACVHEKNDSK